MLHTTLVFIHVVTAVIGLLSGTLAMVFRKGSGLHGAAGAVFFVSMLSMSGSAVIAAAFFKPVAINVVAGLLTAYLVTTARRAAKRREGKPALFDVAAFVYVLAVGCGAWIYGMTIAGMSKPPSGIPAPVYFVFGSAALLCAVSDIRMFRRGGVDGRQRMVRHLWRMCLAFAIALLSFYPGQGRLFPLWLRQTNLLLVPHVLLIGSMLFWRVRYRARKRRESSAAHSPRAEEAAPASVAA